MLKDLYSIMCSIKENSEKQYTVLNNKFDVQNNKFDKLSGDVNEQNNKVDALSSDINAKLNEVSSNVNEQQIKYESSFNELIKCFDESDKKWDKLIDSTKQMHNGYNTESVGVTENGNYDGKLCANKNINKEATVNKVSENNGKRNDNEVSLDVNQVKPVSYTHLDVYKRQV